MFGHTQRQPLKQKDVNITATPYRGRDSLANITLSPLTALPTLSRLAFQRPPRSTTRITTPSTPVNPSHSSHTRILHTPHIHASPVSQAPIQLATLPEVEKDDEEVLNEENSGYFAALMAEDNGSGSEGEEDRVKGRKRVSKAKATSKGGKAARVSSRCVDEDAEERKKKSRETSLRYRTKKQKELSDAQALAEHYEGVLRRVIRHLIPAAGEEVDMTNREMADVCMEALRGLPDVDE